MHTIPRLFAVLAASAALLSAPVALAQDAKSKAAPRADAAAKGKDLYSQAYFDFMESNASPELRQGLAALGHQFASVPDSYM